jgi:hypothetical protein
VRPIRKGPSRFSQQPLFGLSRFLALLPALVSSLVLWNANRLISQIDSLDTRLRASELQMVEVRAYLALRPAPDGFSLGKMPLAVDQSPTRPKNAAATPLRSVLERRGC